MKSVAIENSYIGSGYLIDSDEVMKLFFRAKTIGANSIEERGDHYLFLVKSGIVKMPPFPIILDNVTDKPVIVIDVREFLNKEDEVAQFHSRSVSSLVLMGVIGLSYYNGDKSLFIGDLGFAGVGLGQITFQSLKRNYNLSMSDSEYVKAVMALFYYQRFVSEPLSEKQKIVAFRKFGGIDGKRLSTYSSSIEVPNSLAEVVELLKDHPETVKMRQLTVPAFLTTVRGLRYGAHADTISSLALDYPPALIVLTYEAIQTTGSRQTQLGRALSTVRKPDEKASFIQRFNQLVTE